MNAKKSYLQLHDFTGEPFLCSEDKCFLDLVSSLIVQKKI